MCQCLVFVAEITVVIEPDRHIKTLFFSQDYIFSLLTGYCDPPAGIDVPDALTYNPYFAGCMIGMPQQLFPESVEYDDGESAFGGSQLVTGHSG